MDAGRGEDLTFPRREFVMVKSCLDVFLARIWCCRKRFWLDAYNVVDKFVGRTKYLVVNERSRLDPLSSPQEAGFQRKRTKE